MAQVYPFRAFRYNPARAPFDRVLTQPYDKISPAHAGKILRRDPHNLIAVEKGRSYPDDTPQNNVYTRAAAALEEWIRNMSWCRIPRRRFTPTRRNTRCPARTNGARAADSSARGSWKNIPREWFSGTSTRFPGRKADRLELLRHTKMHTGQLFMLYSDEQRRIDAILAEAEVGGERRPRKCATNTAWCTGCG